MSNQITIANDPDDLAARLARMDGIIAFDGPPGAGKSHLATAMAERLGCHHVDGDDHLDKKRGVYLPALRLDDLRSAIMVGFGASPRVLFIAYALARLSPVSAWSRRPMSMSSG